MSDTKDIPKKTLKIEHNFQTETTSVEFKQQDEVCVSVEMPDPKAELVRQVLQDVVPF